MLAYQSVEIGGTKEQLGLQPVFKDLLCGLVNYHICYELKMCMPRNHLWCNRLVVLSVLLYY